VKANACAKKDVSGLLIVSNKNISASSKPIHSRFRYCSGDCETEIHREPPESFTARSSAASGGALVDMTRKQLSKDAAALK
jgi:hypothetical protein